MKMVELRDLCQISTGQPAPKPSVFSDTGIPFIRAGSLGSLIDGMHEDALELIPEDANKGFKLFPKGTIVFAKSGMSAKIGRVHQIRRDSYLVSHLAAVVPGPQADSNYLRHWFRHFPPSRLIANDAYPSIRTSEIASIKLPLVSLSEQKRIAAILDKAEDIRRKRQQAMAMAEEFLRSVFLDMFGDPVTNPKAWNEKKLKTVSEIVSGVTKGRKFNGRPTVMVPYMRVANVQDGHLNLDDVTEIEVFQSDIEKYRLVEGDLLLTEGGDPDKLGRGAVWKGQIKDCIHQNHIFRVRPDSTKLLPEYLSAQIGSVRGKRYFLKAAKQTTGIASINKTQLSNYPVLIPPMKLQLKYSDIVEQHKRASDAITGRFDMIDDLFGSLTQRAFRGEL